MCRCKTQFEACSSLRGIVSDVDKLKLKVACGWCSYQLTHAIVQQQCTDNLTGNIVGYFPLSTHLPAPTWPPCDCQNHFVNLNGYKLQMLQTDVDKPLNMKQPMVLVN